jgi:predicted patatin/cPLA2 family phospholipase
LLKYLELQKIGYSFAKNKIFNITLSALVDDISIFANNVQNILTLFNSVENWALYNQVNVNITKTEYVNNYEIIKKKTKKQLKLENAQKNQRKITEFFKVKPKVSTDKDPKEKKVIAKMDT